MTRPVTKTGLVSQVGDGVIAPLTGSLAPARDLATRSKVVPTDEQKE